MDVVVVIIIVLVVAVLIVVVVVVVDSIYALDGWRRCSRRLWGTTARSRSQTSRTSSSQKM